MPTHAFNMYVERDGLVVAVDVQKVQRNRGNALSESPIRLLKRYDVGVDFAQHLQYTFWVSTAVCADGFAHIIGGNLDHCPIVPFVCR